MKNGDYTLIVAPDDWPGKKYRDRYCYEHHVVYWRHTGDIIGNGECIHHVNGEKTDNRVENLKLLSVAEHNAGHGTGRAMTVLQCNLCGKQFERESRNVNASLKIGQKDFYCSNECSRRVRRKQIHELTCPVCGVEFKLDGNLYRLRKKRNKTGGVTCSRSCGGILGNPKWI